MGVQGGVEQGRQDLATALSLSRPQFEAQHGFKQPRPEDRNVVLTCRSGRRVELAYNLFLERGFTQIRCYLGSLLDWKKNRGPVVYTSGEEREDTSAGTSAPSDPSVCGG